MTKFFKCLSFIITILSISSCVSRYACIMVSSIEIEAFSKKGVKLINNQEPYTSYEVDISHRDSCNLVHLLRMSNKRGMPKLIKYDPLDNYRVFIIDKDNIWFVANSKIIDSSIAGKFYLLEICELKYLSDDKIELSVKFMKNLERRLKKIGRVEISEIGDDNLRSSLLKFEENVYNIKTICQNERFKN